MHRVGKRSLNPEIALHHIFEQPDELSAVRARALALHTRCLDRMRTARENRYFTALLELNGDMLRETSGRFVSVPLNFAVWFEMNDAHAAPAGPGAALLALADEIAALWKEGAGLPRALYPVSPTVLHAIRKRGSFYGDRTRSFTVHHLNALLICLGMALYDAPLDVQERVRDIVRAVAPYTADMLLPDRLFRASPAGFRALYLGGESRFTSVMLMGAGLAASVVPMTSRLLEVSYPAWKRGLRGRAGYDRHEIVARTLAGIWCSAAAEPVASLDNTAAYSNDYLW